MQRVTLQDRREVHFHTANESDIHGLLKLYKDVYGGKYTIPEATDPEFMKKKIHDPNYFWLVAHLNEIEIIGSVIFAIDPLNKIGKAYAAAVRPEFRGQDIMRNMVKIGLERLTQKTRTCDVIYATTRTVSFAPQVVLEHLGFLPMGVFPNVRKVQSFETHGLEIYFREGTIAMRRRCPQLVPEVVEFYKIVRNLLSLEEHTVVELPLADPRKMGDRIHFVVDRDEEKILKLFDEYQNRDKMDKVFFPFHEPNILFKSEDGSAEIFVGFNHLDGMGVVLGYRIANQDLRRVLMWFCEAAANEGMRYLELLVNAFRPDLQRLAIDAKFLPCAYFPAMRMTKPDLREDYIVFSRSFESLDFMDMQLSETNRKFLDAFMKCWYEMLVRCQPDFEDGWRIG